MGNKNKNPKNYIKNGFLVAKALGYDTFATYMDQYKRYMVNTNTYNLMPVYDEFKKVVPESVLVRGVMLMQPQGLSKRKNITEDKFLKMVGIK